MIEDRKLVSKISSGRGRSNSFDVIIIGGGIMGCSNAYELARRGMTVAVVDKGTIGDSPSGKSSAIIRQHYSNELTARMALYGLGVFQEFDERIGGECGFTKTGFMLLVDAKDRQGLESNIALQQAVGIDTEILQTEAVSEILPGLSAVDLVSVAFEPESGYADPYLTVNAFAQAARRQGATIFQENRVLEVTFAGGKVSGVRTQDGKLNAPVVVNCSGAWGAQVAEMAGVQVPINACRVQVAFFRRPRGQESPHPVVADFSNATYFRSETGGLTLVGLIDPAEAEAVVNPDSFKEYMDDEFLLDVGERLVSRYPAMEQSESTGGYSSLYAITPDWHPIIDEVPAGSGFYICSGFSGHGFKLAPAIGLMMAELISGVSNPQFDSHLFRLARFEEGDQVTGGYEYSIVG
jgi:glycine/D-amino acid oxidase-like deaminating enzyme